MVQTDRRMILALMAAFGVAPAARAAQGSDLHRTSDPAVLLAATRSLLAEDRLCTFITIDAQGHPRARTVFLSAPDGDLTLWIGTRVGSRKLDQIAGHPQATIHVSLDAQASYASLSGQAHRVTDAALIERKNPYQGEMRATYFPRYPDDFALIAFRPEWLEVMTQELPGRRETWQPEGIRL